MASGPKHPKANKKMQSRAAPGPSIPRLIATSFFFCAALVGLGTLLYFGGRAPSSSLRHGAGAAGGEPRSAAAAAHGAALGSHVSHALGASSVLSAFTPSRVVRRTFRDEASGAEVTEESAYFDVPEGEGEALAAAVRREQQGKGAGLDEILLRKARVMGGEAAPAVGDGASAASDATARLASRKGSLATDTYSMLEGSAGSAMDAEPVERVLSTNCALSLEGRAGLAQSGKRPSGEDTQA